MTNTARDQTSMPTQGGTAKILPIVVVVALPLAFGVWWLAREQPADDGPAPAADQQANDDGKSAREVDPWQNITQTIYPLGVVETIHVATGQPVESNVSLITLRTDSQDS